MVFVQSIRGKRLMPCTEAKARHLLEAKRAICICREPFTIKLRFKGLTGFIFGRRSSGSFDIRKLDRTKVSACANYKKLVLVRTRKTYLMERRVRDSSHD